MKKTFTKFLVFMVLMCAIDTIVGLSFDYLQDNTTNSKTGRLIHNPQDEVIILGSSKSENHYVSRIFEDTLGVSVYNYGCPGNGIILMYGRMLLIAESHIPKVIIYDILPHMDIEKNDNSKYINTLKPLYRNAVIKSYIDDVCPSERYKMISSMYRYNSNFMEVLKSYLLRNDVDSDKGYSPGYGQLKYEKNVNAKTAYIGTVDSLKYHYMESFIKEYKDKTKLIFVFSPRFKEYDNSDKVLKELFKKYNVTYLDCQQMEPYFSNKEYWNDGIHMNDKGASLFSQFMASFVKHDILSR